MESAHGEKVRTLSLSTLDCGGRGRAAASSRSRRLRFTVSTSFVYSRLIVPHLANFVTYFGFTVSGTCGMHATMKDTSKKG